LAGLYEGDIILSATKSVNNTEKNGIIYEKQKWPGGVVPYFISAQFGKYLNKSFYLYSTFHQQYLQY